MVRVSELRLLQKAFSGRLCRPLTLEGPLDCFEAAFGGLLASFSHPCSLRHGMQSFRP